MGVATECMTLVLSFSRASPIRPQSDCERSRARACFWSEPLRVAAGQEKCQKREQDIPKPNGFGLRQRRAPARVGGEGRPVTVDRSTGVRSRAETRPTEMTGAAGADSE